MTGRGRDFGAGLGGRVVGLGSYWIQGGWGIHRGDAENTEENAEKDWLATACANNCGDSEEPPPDFSP